MSEQEIRWKDGSRIKNRPDPEVAHAEIERIDKLHGKATAELVVQASKKKTAPLHHCFTWDDTVAGEQWRKREARKIMGALEVVVVRGDAPPSRAPAFVNVERGEGYRPIEIVMECESMRSTILERARQDLNHWRRRYGHLKKYSELVDIIDELE